MCSIIFVLPLISTIMFLKLIVLLTNREIIDLIGEAWPQTERLFECVDQSSITFLRWSAKRLNFPFLC